MAKYLRRVAQAVVLAVTVMLVTMPIGQAAGNGNAGQAQYNFEHQVNLPDVSTPSAAALVMKQNPVDAAAMAQVAEIRAGIQLTKTGFATTNPKFITSVNQINAGLARYRATQAQPKPWLGATQAQAGWWCIYLPGWWFHAVVDYMYVEGGIFATVSLFVDATVVGIPIGAALGALGIWYGLQAYFVDRVFSWRGYYTWGAWVCI